VLPARDDDGRVRMLEFAELGVSKEVKEIHANRLDDRARTEGRDQDFRMVADDVDAISEGRLIGRPTEGD
jgi:methylaspartate mutase epsilon subunit